MFSGIGDKIKTVAMVLCIIGIITSVAVGVQLIGESFMTAVLTIVIGCLTAVVSTMCLYGFGELIEETARNRQINEEILRNLRKLQNPEAEPTGEERAAAIGTHEIQGGGVYWPDGHWNCRKCGAENKREDRFCKACGEYK